MQNVSTTTEKDCFTVWENCLRVIRNHIEPQAFMTWFEPITPHHLKDNVLSIEVPSKFFYEYLEENFVHLLREAIDEALGTNGRLEYYLKGEDETPTNGAYVGNVPNGHMTNYGTASQGYASSQKTNGAVPPAMLSNFKLNTNYSFDNFIEGDCNRLARSAGLAVAQKPGVTAFNPLMLYGGVGLGKTHLIQAIGNYIQTYENERRVVYISADRFTNQFIESVKNNNLEAFNHYYQQVDVLMIDDVQFLSGKDRTQEIFFHIFNHLHQAGKQIIMTSDCPPNDLKGLEERLLSRFKWGLTADLKQPDLETRMAIIQKKISDTDIYIPEEVIEYLANSVDSNVRELEGAINSLIWQASASNQDITLEMAKDIVEKIVQSAAENREISIDAIQKAVSQYFAISIEELKAKTRKKEIVTARQIAMYFAKEYTGFSLKSIGYHFGGRDHSTVIHAIQTVNDYIKERREFKAHVDDLRKLLEKP
ncbi:MAG: chromosomal replication initiator protein DnaA [Microscillaceae bacterium]